ncbi:helix-turn-helix domain-containing protein [Oxalobacter formigenes]|uniref:DNA-binding helix-turn-helix protein n=1 Tax=Oxalobacter formigenes OXCC13 TaxID=556269 RepID=C3X7Y9_OXAFO|nr:helix-turn-helix domain-containing protein [Oxalobacter formigenes]ARQ46655.1 Antitoxin igA-2 [Oxalobacter formigenes]ARQ78729.1 transcriptional regulator [Oxalobacter formigenes OXCC13]EEO29315.1 DNA-binding helix-turn-helix protein [Oxalobacter formigenes OXCC13]MCZ4061865.1 helix-turn-helix domain-containing protein [Oxalobacter formigenes]QDX32692.1 helix-turn-helix domain-containing protein [Oxalobacter formigenes]
MDKEMNAFCEDLLESAKQMKEKKAARKTVVVVSDITRARNKVNMSQPAFAKLMGVSVRTLQAWEQGKRNPSGAAKTLLRVAETHPEILRKLARH